MAGDAGTGQEFLVVHGVGDCDLGIIPSRHRILQRLTVWYALQVLQSDTMFRHTTEKVSLQNCTGLSIDTFNSGCVRFSDEGQTIEIYGAGIDKINSEIRGYVRCQGYHLSKEDLERSSASL